MKKKENYIARKKIHENKEIFHAKQKIAIEKFGEIFEDETFFALELMHNMELSLELDREYDKKYNIKKNLC
ncbi:hypothetical protein [Peptostreptococcus canis]|uniref:Uncharacterized protein n=1 Tax=Peptostreptococcus canis TaxID=1159213 RepID=A0ABR6TJL6_9FIRM|nr:hypothetical protein [Peptostreptococcus canis]MBC2575423.1 hypothetical protein [Peptostreptococcus canis]MBP1997388.1 hypothetical protein [Peptostreptococcus canis]